MAGVEEYLRDAIEELPLISQPLLASHLGTRLPEAIVQAAGTAAWERYTARQADELVRHGRPAQALKVIRERKERTPGSPLYLIEAKALALTGAHPSAHRAVQKAIQAAATSGNRSDLLDAILLEAQIAEERGKLADADASLQQAIRVAATLDDPTKQALAISQRMRVMALAQQPALSDLRYTLAQLLGVLSDSQWLENRDLIRTSVALLGIEYADLALRMLRRVGLGPLDQRQIAVLAGAIADVRHDPNVEQVTTVFANTLDLAKQSSRSARDLILALRRAERLDEYLERLLPALLKQPELSRRMSDALVEIYTRRESAEQEQAP
jgi:hypothetical protein